MGKKVPAVKEETHLLKTLIKSGLDRIEEDPKLLDNLGRVGIVTNQAVTNSRFTPCAEILSGILKNSKNSKLIAVFGPQHGYYQTEQDNMLETPDQTIQLQGVDVPLFSLYSETRIPKESQMDLVDTLVVDLLDVGCRVYTYMLTLAGCMRQAAQFKKRVIVLDRANPQGLSHRSESGSLFGIEGNTLDPVWESFVGWYPIPMKHGLSMGELARYFKSVDNLDLDLRIIQGEGYNRNQGYNSVFEHCQNLWTTPSPNLPTLNTALLFSAFVILEGTNISEGRGTTLPFQTIGAPYLKSDALLADLKWIQSQSKGNTATSFQSVQIRRQDFRPTFNKHAGQWCQGLQFHPELSTGKKEAPAFNTFALGVFTLGLIAIRHGESLQWKAPGYEYNTTDCPLHLIFGTDVWTQHFEMLRGLGGGDLANHRQILLESTSELLFKAHFEAESFFEATKFAWNEPV